MAVVRAVRAAHKGGKATVAYLTHTNSVVAADTLTHEALVSIGQWWTPKVLEMGARNAVLYLPESVGMAPWPKNGFEGGEPSGHTYYEELVRRAENEEMLGVLDIVVGATETEPPSRYITVGVPRGTPKPPDPVLHSARSEGRQVRPKIRPVSQMIDPTPLPRARPEFPIQAAMTETKASGVVVPRETMVAPITILGIPVRRARCTTPSTIQLAPLVRTAMARTATIARSGNERSENRDARA